MSDPLTEPMQACPCHYNKLVFVTVVMIKKGIVFEKSQQAGEVPSDRKRGNTTIYF